MERSVDCFAAFQLGDKEEDVAGVTSLRVSVAVCTAVLPSEEGELISYGEYEEFEAPTKGRAGGIQ
jgi:tyrosinase